MPFIYYTTYQPISKSLSEVRLQEHTLGRELLAEGLCSLYRIPASPKALPGMLGITDNGKPWLRDYPQIHFNITHCEKLVACAFHDLPVGVDAELPGYFAKILIRRALSEQEKSFLRYVGKTPELEQEWFYRFWTLKEAYVKKTGTGVDTDLTGFSFTFCGNQEPFEIHCSDPSVSCRQKKLPGGQILSLCYESTGGNSPLDLCYQEFPRQTQQ